MKKAKTPAKSAREKTDIAATYNSLKEFEGRKYTGMKIGRAHKWNYDPGVWREKKVTPDLWQIDYAVTKRRAGRAPEGSGVPVGNEYHWYIVADQNVKKLNANDYSTAMAGLKFKIAHKRADTEKWSATPSTQRKRLIKFLQEVIDSLENEAAEEESNSLEKKASEEERNPIELKPVAGRKTRRASKGKTSARKRKSTSHRRAA